MLSSLLVRTGLALSLLCIPAAGFAQYLDHRGQLLWGAGVAQVEDGRAAPTITTLAYGGHGGCASPWTSSIVSSPACRTLPLCGISTPLIRLSAHACRLSHRGVWPARF